ncbi:hypothetical protein OG552_14145 [Streptomyces sp. NBC_01476]|uniref:hypothetical protein n=1 Tax=Streptomyces sp. NBC_01476 TaxID=2903881 RepID=UPI002E3580E0|nr:hypothetical protein [Streptomyces sp. NBC_01476]
MSTARDPDRTPDTGPADGAAPADAVGEDSASGSPGTRPAAGSSGHLVFDDPLDRPSSDDTDRGWGGTHSGAGEDDFERFLNEKPPHHL